MGKHLVDIDERALADAQHVLGTSTMKDTVNQALRLAAESGREQLDQALDTLTDIALDDRRDAWR